MDNVNISKDDFEVKVDGSVVSLSSAETSSGRVILTLASRIHKENITVKYTKSGNVSQNIADAAGNGVATFNTPVNIVNNTKKISVESADASANELNFKTYNKNNMKRTFNVSANGRINRNNNQKFVYTMIILRNEIELGTNYLNKNKIRNAGLKLIFASNETLKEISTTPYELRLNHKIKTRNVTVVKADETINVNEMLNRTSGKNEAFYVPLEDGEFTSLIISTGNTVKITNNGDKTIQQQKRNNFLL